MIFRLPTPQKIVTTQLEEARRARLEHQAAAEHHQALADMFAAREKRLEAEHKEAA